MRQTRQPIELVVNEVEGDRVAGYLSALKGTMLAQYAKPDPVDDPDWEPFKIIKKETAPVSQKTGSAPLGSAPPNP